MVKMAIFLASWYTRDIVATFVSFWIHEVMFRPFGPTFCYK